MQDSPEMPRTLAERIDAIEQAYEFMLGYAAQGRQRGDEGDQIREFLTVAEAALDGLAESARDAVHAAAVNDAAFAPFIAVMEEDAGKALAGIRLALGQLAIGSQLVDNLNASIHLRALLTDLFLIDEALGSRRTG